MTTRDTGRGPPRPAATAWSVSAAWAGGRPPFRRGDTLVASDIAPLVPACA